MEKNTFLEHLQELRSRLLKSLFVVMACFLSLIYFSNDIRYQYQELTGVEDLVKKHQEN